MEEAFDLSFDRLLMMMMKLVVRTVTTGVERVNARSTFKILLPVRFLIAPCS